MEEILMKAALIGAKFQMRYADYSEDEWTIPVDLTPARIQTILNDASMVQVRIIFDCK